MKVIFVFVFCLFIFFNVMRTNTNKENYPDTLVTENNSTYSLSGKYKLSLHSGSDNNVQYYYFTISSDNTVLYTSDEKYYKRFTLFLSWDDNADIVWCYSSDIGTYYWVYENGNWEKYTYAHNKGIMQVPNVFRKLRPKYFP